MRFQFTHPGRGATRTAQVQPTHRRVSIHAPREGCDPHHRREGVAGAVFQFTHPGRGATPRVLLYVCGSGVSIHAPREGCDGVYLVAPCCGGDVSIHAPREGCDCAAFFGLVRLSMFQFTHPGRGATRCACWRFPTRSRFNSRTPGGVRPFSLNHFDLYLLFQFTHPGRGATPTACNGSTSITVSIHAPREGCDNKH